MHYSFFKQVSLLGFGLIVAGFLGAFFVKGWMWACAVAVGGFWVFLNSYFLYQLLEISLNPKPRQSQKIMVFSIIKFPVLYLIGFFILRTRVFPVYGILAGLTLYFAAILTGWAKFNILGPRPKGTR